ncbi:MAG TPA: hypothetical protein VNC50_06645 [Planctomycetia bacterium]|nr:hypothetical protein [Planctomycetia bacterium]
MLREYAEDSRRLVIPSQFNRDDAGAPEPSGESVVITFDGPEQSLYATLAVRCGAVRFGRGGPFTTAAGTRQVGFRMPVRGRGAAGADVVRLE